MAKVEGEQRNVKTPLLDFASTLRLTLKAWPVIAAATIGLCYLTQTVAKGFGIELPDQANIEIVKRYAGWNKIFIFLCTQILLWMPVIEEFYFRHFLYRRPQEPISRHGIFYALIPTCVILAAGVCTQLGFFGPASHDRVLYSFRTCAHPWLCFWLAVSLFSSFEYTIRVFLGRLIAKTSAWSIAVFSAILFSAAHYLAQPFPDSAFLALCFFGLAQCWLYKKTGHLWCAILNHGLFNLTNLVLLFILPEA